MDKQLLAFITMTFSKQFLKLRKDNKLTQQEMADKCGMHITQVRRYEADQAQPSIEILKKIALAFNVTADWLIFEEGERALPNNLQLVCLRQLCVNQPIPRCFNPLHSLTGGSHVPITILDRPKKRIRPLASNKKVTPIPRT